MKSSRYLISFDTAKLPVRTTDLLVIGSGIAGLRAAIEASQFGKVLLITKATLNESNTIYAQGGIAAHINRARLISTHIQDTLAVGQDLNNKKVVRQLIRKSVELIRELINWGVKFDRRNSHYDLAQEGGHKLPRILHCGDRTGQEIIRVLLDKVQGIINIENLENTFVIDLLTDRTRTCHGALIYQKATQGTSVIQAKKTILATGGCGQLYRETTNPSIATGDGITMAHRAGAVLQDMEFVQFHPTAFYVAGAARTLISEVVRGAGGILRNKAGERFMTKYHPSAELAPRDIVVRSIAEQIRLTGDTNVYLDLTHLSHRKIKTHFPGLYNLCKTFGIDVTKEYIPVRPSAHYMIGGVRTRKNMSTGIPNLFAAGEVAASGFHGANRLGSNSLLEGLVQGALVGKIAGEQLNEKPHQPLKIKYKRPSGFYELIDINIEDARNSLKSLMWRDVGIERKAKRLREALRKIDFWKSYVLDKEFTEPAGWELQNLLIIANLITRSALHRTESRGVHFRADFPLLDNSHWKKHILIRK